jgi:hypothetical protein
MELLLDCMGRTLQLGFLEGLYNGSRQTKLLDRPSGTRTTNSLCHRDYCPDSPWGIFHLPIMGLIPEAVVRHSTRRAKQPQGRWREQRIGEPEDSELLELSDQAEQRGLILIMQRKQMNNLLRLGPQAGQWNGSKFVLK